MAKVFTITEGLENMGALKTGGQGSVYKGRRIGEILTAIKLLPTPIHSESAEDKNFTSFQNEVQKLKKVNEQPNPNVVKILSSGITESGNFPYIEMEFIEGPDLEELLKPPHNPIFTIKEVLKVADQLSYALAHCHKVDVRHGDVKSNNVKFNTRTGNYILLDFGLSAMSDEQRRSSFRHAGAIEFMAPEQNEGRILFQTDVYSFGVVMFELLAGTVPFPLKDKGETARNHVMVAHMETPPPNLLALRRQALPPTWDVLKRDKELQLPEWLVEMIYKCLEKNPDKRFANGVELHEFIWQNSIQTFSKKDDNTEEQLKALLQENKRLFREKEQLEQQLLRYQQGPSNTREHTQSIANTDQSFTPEANVNKPGFRGSTFLLSLVVLLAIGSLVYFLVTKADSKTTQQAKPAPVETLPKTTVIGEYKVLAAKAYFYNQPDETTKRAAYAIPSGEILKAYDDKNDFIYTQIVNPKGQVSKGWLRKQDLLTLDEWTRRNENVLPKPQAVDQNVTIELSNARRLMDDNNWPEAISIYSKLSQQQVPEAMYEYGNLALQNRNDEVDCARAFDLLVSASSKGYAPAKRTLGFLYCYADNDEVLKNNNYYERCSFNKNVSKGSQLLLRAMLQGDTIASRLLDELNLKKQ